MASIDPRPSQSRSSPAALPGARAVARGDSLGERLRSWLTRQGPTLNSAGAAARLARVLLRDLARQTHSGATRPPAARWRHVYDEAGDNERLRLIEALGSELAGFLEAPRDALIDAFLNQLHACPGGLAWLVQFRAQLLVASGTSTACLALERSLARLFSEWFDVKRLQMREISWDSPASLLEKLIRYEAVHAISSWNDLRNRLDSDRHCYALFHPEMGDEPLIFVELALHAKMAGDLAELLDQSAPLADPGRARWAIFYSISNTQPGLRGISFGNFLLKRVMARLAERDPQIRAYATLSPIPGLRNWVCALDARQLDLHLGERHAQRLRRALSQTEMPSGAALAQALVQQSAGARHEALREAAMRLALAYLSQQPRQGVPLDPVARFHLGNGARVERLNWFADPSEQGQQQSFGIMVNYRYVPEKLERYSARLHDGTISFGRAARRLI